MNRYNTIHKGWRLLFLLSLSFQYVVSQDIPGIQDDPEKQLEVWYSKVFDGTSLWGYIDGGADVFLEYGFEQLYVQKIRKGNLQCEADIYRMKDPGAAFGMYSISTFRCEGKMEGQPESCLNRYQLQFRKGRYYVSLQNDMGDEASAQLMKEMYRILEEQIPEAPPFFPWLEEAGSVEGLRIKYAYGPLGLQNGMPQWYDWLSDSGSYSLVLLSSGSEDGWLAWMETSTPAQMEEWEKRFRASEGPDVPLKYEKTGPNTWCIAQIIEEGKSLDQLYARLLNLFTEAPFQE